MKNLPGVVALAVVAMLIGFASALWGCNSYSSSGPYPSYTPPPPPANTAANTVLISGYAFSPSTLAVTKGTAVTWQNNDGVVHTSTSDNSAWDTGDIAPGATKTATFNAAGTFTYHCAMHPMMTAKIVVQ